MIIADCAPSLPCVLARCWRLIVPRWSYRQNFHETEEQKKSRASKQIIIIYSFATHIYRSISRVHYG